MLIPAYLWAVTNFANGSPQKKRGGVSMDRRRHDGYRSRLFAIFCLTGRRNKETAQGRRRGRRAADGTGSV